MNHYVASDIHGDLRGFMTLLSQCPYNPVTDRLYLLGDVIDYGEAGTGVLEYCVRHPEITLLKGNHEYFMEESLKDPDGVIARNWPAWGGIESMESLSWNSRDGFIEILSALPLTKMLTINSRQILLAHNGFNSKARLFCDHALINARKTIETDLYNRDHQFDAFCSIDFFLNYKEKEEKYPFTTEIILGHAPVQYISGDNSIFFGPNYTAIDCGRSKVKSGRIGMLRLEDMAEFYYPK
ncbi:MAG: metallophosphoesterase [Eubacteriaceae bacterium]|jgi:serine/threonine protein phosphatase 1